MLQHPGGFQFKRSCGRFLSDLIYIYIYIYTQWLFFGHKSWYLVKLWARCFRLGVFRISKCAKQIDPRPPRPPPRSMNLKKCLAWSWNAWKVPTACRWVPGVPSLGLKWWFSLTGKIPFRKNFSKWWEFTQNAWMLGLVGGLSLF